MTTISPSEMESLKAQIGNAIARSISSNEIVTLKINGETGDALEAVKCVTDWPTGYTVSDYEGEDRMEIWGFEDSSDTLWRLSITFSGN